MATTPYRDGHLMVACIRVLEALRQHPPQEGEIAELLGWPQEKVTFLLRGLVEEGILARVGSAFDERYEIRDHRKLEDLPMDEEDPGIAADLAAFEQKQAREQEKLERLFLEGETPRKQRRLDDLDGEFERFRRQKPANPFGDDDTGRGPRK